MSKNVRKEDYTPPMVFGSDTHGPPSENVSTAGLPKDIASSGLSDKCSEGSGWVDEKRMKEVTKDLEWKNIDHEQYRIYSFVVVDRVVRVVIDNPVLLNVSKSGGHRILDADNISHYIPYKWVSLAWETKDNIAFRF